MIAAVGLSSCGRPNDQSFGNPYAILEQQMSAASYVFVANMIADGSSGELVLDPVVMFKGELPTDADGRLHLGVTKSYRDCTGLWLLDGDLHPMDNLPSLNPLLEVNPMKIDRNTMFRAFPDVGFSHVLPGECQ